VLLDYYLLLFHTHYQLRVTMIREKYASIIFGSAAIYTRQNSLYKYDLS